MSLSISSTEKNGQDNENSSDSWKYRRSSDDNQFSAPEATTSVKQHKNVQELTINKLNYGAISLVGREKETEILRTCLDQASSSSARNPNGHYHKQLILIHGYSGVGKSAIIQQIKSERTTMMAQGKFDQNYSNEPYSGIAKVLDQIMAKIKQGVDDQDAHSVAVQNAIKEMESEIPLLQTLIPTLSELFPEYDGSTDSASSSSANRNFAADLERIKYSFRVLTRILSEHFSPLVFVLEDLQWADASSLQTIDFLLSDTENINGLVIIGLYRSNEVDDSHPLTHSIQTLGEKSSKFDFDITNIKLKSLDVTGINRIIMAMLNIDDGDESKTQGLADICFRRTLGNPFFCNRIYHHA